MDKMSLKIKKALPIVKGYLKRHPVPLHVFDDVFQTLTIALWKSIKKQQSTHQQYQLAHIFEYQARSDLKDEYYLKSMIRIPAKRTYDKEWQINNMPVVFSYDDKPEDSAIHDIHTNNELSPFDEVSLSETLNNMTASEQTILKGRYNGQSFKEIGQSMGLKSEIMPLQIMRGIRVKLGLIEAPKQIKSESVVLRETRNATIRQLSKSGLTQHQISQQINIPRTTIQNILSKTA